METKETLIAAYPTLILATPEMRGATLASKNIKRMLKKFWPQTKFSVRAVYASMMSAVRVNWVDGPTTDKVEGIIDLFAYGDFDGMDDSYNNRKTGKVFRELFGDAKYVTASRSWSPAAKAAAIEAVAAKFGVKPITDEQYEAGAYWTKVAMDRDWSQLMRDYFEERFAFAPSIEPAVETPAKVEEPKPTPVNDNVVYMAEWLKAKAAA